MTQLDEIRTRIAAFKSGEYKRGNDWTGGPGEDMEWLVVQLLESQASAAADRKEREVNEAAFLRTVDELRVECSRLTLQVSQQIAYRDADRRMWEPRIEQLEDRLALAVAVVDAARFSLSGKVEDLIGQLNKLAEAVRAFDAGGKGGEK